jgi:hypothetical protein
MCPRVAQVDDMKCPFAGISCKPSDGLEPSTPPYHRATRREARAQAGSRGHESRGRRRNRRKASDRAWPRLPGLVFPRCSLD